MPYNFLTSYSPPAPTLPVAIREPENGVLTLEMTAIIDTGADGTIVPAIYLRGLEMYKSHTTNMRSHWGESRRVSVYLVDLDVAGEVLPGVEVVADERSREILLDRNILNRLILLLDGVRGQTDILTRRPVRF
jgi:predicted aspartyl protease